MSRSLRSGVARADTAGRAGMGLKATTTRGVLTLIAAGDAASLLVGIARRDFVVNGPVEYDPPAESDVRLLDSTGGCATADGLGVSADDDGCFVVNTDADAGRARAGAAAGQLVDVWPAAAGGGGGGGDAAITVTSDAQGSTPLSGVILQNTTDATLAVPAQTSPAFEFVGSAWDTDDLVAREVTIRGYLLPVSAASPYPRLVITRTIGGGAESVIFQAGEGYIAGASWDLASRSFDLANLTMASSNGAANPQIASASANIIVDAAVGARMGFAAREMVFTAQSPNNGGFVAVDGVISTTRGAALAVASNTIAPNATVHHVGAGLIKTITAIFGTGSRTFEGTLVLIPDAAFTWDATDNIAIGGTAVVGRALHMTYDANTTKWYPSYV